MKKYTFLLFFFWLSVSVFAQGQDSYLWLSGKNAGYSETNQINVEGIIGVKNCYVRDMPSTAGKLIDSLQLGKKITVLSKTEKTQKLKRIDMNWVEIQYQLPNRDIRKGYLWLGFLALDYKETNGLKFLTVLERINAKKEEDYVSQEHVIAVKVLDENNLVLDSKEIKKPISESYYYQQSLLGNQGLKNIQELYRISFSGEACGIPTYFFYFGWTGKKLLLLPEKMKVGDAGVYYHSENFIFPKEPGGKPDYIYKIIEEAEAIDSENNEDYMMREKVWKETYSWDGEKASLLKKVQLKEGIIKQ